MFHFLMLLLSIYISLYNFIIYLIRTKKAIIVIISLLKFLNISNIHIVWNKNEYKYDIFSSISI